MMTTKDLENLRQIAIEGRKKMVTREDAMRYLINAGIFDKNGNYTKPYRRLGKAIREFNARLKKEEKLKLSNHN